MYISENTHTYTYTHTHTHTHTHNSTETKQDLTCFRDERRKTYNISRQLPTTFKNSQHSTTYKQQRRANKKVQA